MLVSIVFAISFCFLNVVVFFDAVGVITGEPGMVVGERSGCFVGLMVRISSLIRPVAFFHRYPPPN